jgi:hypothetical protein
MKTTRGDDMTLESFSVDARIRAYRSNIGRYRQLLASELTDLERAFVHRRLAEDKRALDVLARLTDAAVVPATSGDSETADHHIL